MVNPQDDANYGDSIRRMKTAMRSEMPPPGDPNSAPPLGDTSSMGGLDNPDSMAGTDLNAMGGGAIKAGGQPPPDMESMAGMPPSTPFVGGVERAGSPSPPITSAPSSIGVGGYGSPPNGQFNQQLAQGAMGSPIKPPMPPPPTAPAIQQQGQMGGVNKAQPQPQQQPQAQPSTDKYSQYASQQPEYAGRPTSPAPQQQSQLGMGGGMSGGSAPMNGTAMKPNMPAPTSQIKPNGNPTYQTRKSTPQ